MTMEYTINSVAIKNPTDFRIERYNLTKSGRVASGLMVMDLLAKKRKFLFRYKAISGTELNNILNLIDGTDIFFTLSYWENNVLKHATCYAGHIPSHLFRRDGVWYWKDVNFDLIER